MTREERAYNYASKKNPSKFTVGEIARHYDDGYADGRKDAIEKACEWLEEHLSEYWSQRITNCDDFIEQFKNTMEE